MPARSGASSSSMNTSSPPSSWRNSTHGSSPSRPSPQRNGANHRNSLVRELYESPSRQMQIEFNLMLINSEREFHKKLDEDQARRASVYYEQLAKVAEDHQKVQESAEREVERLKLEAEVERMRKEVAEKERLQRLREQKLKEEAATRQRELEAKLREEEAARDAAEKQRKLQEAAAKARLQKEQEDAARKQKEEEEKKAKETAAAAPPQVRPQPTVPTPFTPAISAPAATSKTSTSPPSADIIEVHDKYLALHALMKKFRKQFAETHKQPGSPLKAIVGDVRRSINKRMGQVTIDINDSKAVITALRTECFDKALTIGGPTVDIRLFLVSHQVLNESDAQYPAILLYIWCCFLKKLIHQWYNEASKEDARIITQTCLIAASLYADQKYMCKGVPLIDTLLAKLHRQCPMLFGVHGDLQANRAGLGLDKFDVNDESDMNRYSQLMTGIGSGYAALTHRKFAGKPPVIPISEYWRTLVLICNTPSDALYPGHFLCLQGLLRDHIRRFIAVYGVQAKAVLRRATTDLPNRAQQAAQARGSQAVPGLAAAVSLVKVLPDIWTKMGISVQ